MPVHIKINTIFVARLHLYLCGPLEAFVDIKIWSGKSVTAARRGFLSSFSQVVLGWKFWSGVKLLLGGGGKYPTDRAGKAVSTWDTGMCNAFASEFPCFSVFLLFLFFFFCVLLEIYSHSSSDCRSNLSVSLSDLTGSEWNMALCVKKKKNKKRSKIMCRGGQKHIHENQPKKACWWV